MVELPDAARVFVVTDESDALDLLILEWLTLPQAPACGHDYYGAVSPTADLMIYRCKECGELWRGRAGDHYLESWLIEKVFGPYGARQLA